MKKTALNLIVCLVGFFVLGACNGSPANQVVGSETVEATQEIARDEGNLDGENRDGVLDEEIPDLSGETILIYLIGDTSPPYTAITSPIRDGVNDYVEYVNENGGIFGATVDARFANTGGSEEGVVTAYDRFLEEGDNILLLITYGGFEESLYGQANEDKIPVLTFGLNPGLPGIEKGGYVYRLTPTYEEQFAFFLDFILENWKDIKPGGAIDEIKVAYISWDNEYGRSALTEKTRAYAESLEIEIVWEEYLEMLESTSTTAAIFNAEMAGATVIYTNTHGFGPANLLNDLNNLAIRDFFIVGANNWALGTGAMNYLFDPVFADGLYLPNWYAWWTDIENPNIQIAEEILDANGRGVEDKSAGRLMVQGGLDLAIYAIEQAILNEGFENLTGEEIKIVLDKISDDAMLGGLISVDFRNGNRSPNFLQMRQVQGDKGVLVTVDEFMEIPGLIP